MAAVIFGPQVFIRARIVNRAIMTSSSKMQKVMEDLQKNPYFEKYGNKIATLQKNSPEEFVKRIEQKEEEAENARKKRLLESTRQYKSLMTPKDKPDQMITFQNKQLSDIMKMELVKNKKPSEICEIWQTYHKNKDTIAATIPCDAYEKLSESQQKYPIFIFPLPRAQGYEFIMSQVAGNSVHFTPLICYQVHKENAPECLTMVHYTELKDEKGIVLMRGDFDTNVLNAQEAQCLANQFQLYYGQQQLKKTAILELFNRKPDAFIHSDLIAELESITI